MYRVVGENAIFANEKAVQHMPSCSVLADGVPKILHIVI